MPHPTVVVAASSYPVSLQEAKDHLRVTGSETDNYITSLIKAATVRIEKELGIALIERTFEIKFDSFANQIALPNGPVEEVVSVKYLDEDGIEQTAGTELYSTDLGHEQGWIILNSGLSWPATYPVPNAVTIRYKAGHTAIRDEDRGIVQSIFILLSFFYDNRGSEDAPIPRAIRWSLEPYIKVMV